MEVSKLSAKVFSKVSYSFKVQFLHSVPLNLTNEFAAHLWRSGGPGRTNLHSCHRPDWRLFVHRAVCVLGHRRTGVHHRDPAQSSPADVSVGMKVAAHMEHLMEDREVEQGQTYERVGWITYTACFTLHNELSGSHCAFTLTVIVHTERVDIEKVIYGSLYWKIPLITVIHYKTVTGVCL